MKILMVNKFLYPNGGSETYIFKLCDYLKSIGHEVQFFGMEHKDRIVGNNVNSYTSNMDFHSGSKFAKLTYPIRTIYSVEARKKIRAVLDDFQPDVCHLNNFNFQLTPSVILEIVKWRKEKRKECKIIYTAHDYQLVCPAHLCRNPNTNENCEKCLGGKFLNCVKGNCIHSSKARSLVGFAEAEFWKLCGVYKHIDKIICCSNFMKTKLDMNLAFSQKTIVLHNFVEKVQTKQTEKKDYVLYFGRYSKEKGTETLFEVAKKLPHIEFIFAGSGPLEYIFEDAPNIKNVGFQRGEALEALIREARFTVAPSECYENCPFSVLESQLYGTPVLGANIGGIPELIEIGKSGEVFESGNRESLGQKISQMWNAARADANPYKDCNGARFLTVEEYCSKVYF